MQTPSSTIHSETTTPGWPLRLAQRALAAWLDGGGDAPSAIALARRHAALRQTLSVLSADDREHFARWLALLRASRQGCAVGGAAVDRAPPAPARVAMRRQRAAA